MRPVLLTAVGAAALALACASSPGPASPEASPAATAPGPEIGAGAGPCEQIERIVVRKSARVLVVTCTGGAERQLAVALARASGAKQLAGDQSMPEGDYRVVGPARPSRFHRFLPIDYPAPADAARALADGRLSQEDHDAIVAAHRAGRLPPQETPLGGHLGLHGEGSRWQGDLELDWTEGCIAVSDSDIDWLSQRAPPGTPVRIEP